jgi:hypothetical protein
MAFLEQVVGDYSYLSSVPSTKNTHILKCTSSLKIRNWLSALFWITVEQLSHQKQLEKLLKIKIHA